MGEKKKVSSKGKAREEYILTPKLFCGKCQQNMTGWSGTSKTSKLHLYYKCNFAKKKKCDKKAVKKKLIEDFVVNIAREQLTDENISIIITEAEKVYKSEQDNSNLMRLRKQLRDCEAATQNLLKALEQGQAADIITSQLVKRQKEAQELKKLISKEELIYKNFDIGKVKAMLYNLKDGDINDPKYRKALISIFIDRVYLFDDKATILFKTDKSPIEVTVDLLDDLGIGGGSSEVNQAPLYTFKSEHPKIYFCWWVVRYGA